MNARRRQYINAISAYRPAHNYVCRLHEDTDEVWTRCNARRPNGVRCEHKPTEFQPHLLPTCGRHQAKELIRGECKAVLTCGRECLRSFHWTPAHNQLCPEHKDFPMPCYLLTLPQEVRERIYGYVLPRKVDHGYLGPYRAQGFNISGLLRVNRQVSKETLDLLYRDTTFAVIIEPTYIQVANRKWQTHPVPHPSYASGLWIGFGSNNFSQLRSLDLELRVYEKDITTFPPTMIDAITLLEVRMNILRFLGILAQSTSFKSVTVKIHFRVSQRWEQHGVLVGMKPLLDAFSSLRRVSKPDFTGFRPLDEHGNVQSNVQCPDEITDYICDWKRLLARDEPRPTVPNTQCLQLFWKVEDFIYDLVSSHVAQDAGFERFLQRARVAQDANDLSALSTVRDYLESMWEDYLDKRTKLERHLQTKCNGMFDENSELLHPSSESEDEPVVRGSVSALHTFTASDRFRRLSQLKLHWGPLPPELR